MDLGLAGKVALVTASSRGLGRACAESLAREGARVVINGRRPDDLARAAQEIRGAITNKAAAVHTVGGDVTQADDVARLIKATITRFGQLDILVTNSGGPPSGAFVPHRSGARFVAPFAAQNPSVNELFRTYPNKSGPHRGLSPCQDWSRRGRKQTGVMIRYLSGLKPLDQGVQV